MQQVLSTRRHVWTNPLNQNFIYPEYRKVFIMKATLFLAGMASTGLAMPATEHWGEKELLKVDIPTDTVKMEDLRATKLKAWEEMRANGEFDDGRYHAQAMTKCEGGKAGDYACMNMDLMHFLPHADMGSKSKTGNDVWGKLYTGNM